MVYIVNGVKVDPNGVPLTGQRLATLTEVVTVASDVVPPAEAAEPAEPLEDMTAQEVLDAVDSGEVSKADALAAEKKRATPRKTVTEGL